MKIITLDQAYEMYNTRKVKGFYCLSASDEKIPFGKFVDVLKISYHIY